MRPEAWRTDAPAAQTEPDAPPALRPHPWEDPDVPDERGLVWCNRCWRRVTPVERRRHRGGHGREWERLVELSEEELDRMRPRRSRQAGWEVEGF